MSAATFTTFHSATINTHSPSSFTSSSMPFSNSSSSTTPPTTRPASLRQAEPALLHQSPCTPSSGTTAAHTMLAIRTLDLDVEWWRSNAACASITKMCACMVGCTAPRLYSTMHSHTARGWSLSTFNKVLAEGPKRRGQEGMHVADELGVGDMKPDGAVPESWSDRPQTCTSITSQ